MLETHWIKEELQSKIHHKPLPSTICKTTFANYRFLAKASMHMQD
jgi:hypothetical protein